VLPIVEVKVEPPETMVVRRASVVTGVLAPEPLASLAPLAPLEALAPLAPPE
jgi:hypothetical protein